MNMPHRHMVGQDEYSRGALGGLAYRRDNMPMRQQPHFVREWREFRGLNQVQFAERIGITQGQLSKIENGKRHYDQEFLERAALELRCSPADLIVRNPQDPEGIWSVWDQLQPVQRVQLVEIGKTLKTGTDG